MTRKIILDIQGGSIKQYSTLVLELNNMAKNWRKFGVTINLPEQERIITWGNRKYNENIEPEVHN